MGLNTVLLILNDHLGSIERDPEFGSDVAEAVAAYPHSERFHITGQTKVISTSHADDYQIVVVHGNIGVEVSRFLTLTERSDIVRSFHTAISKRSTDEADQ